MDEKLFKVLLIGDAKVGKTAFVQRYVNGTFRNDYRATVGVDFALKVLRLSDTECARLQLWDIQGQERLTSMTRVYYRDASACIIFYDVTERQSYDNVIRWKQDLDEKVTLPDGTNVPCLLVGNKCDLQQTCVPHEDVQRFAVEHKFLAWKEISVKTGFNVNESMDLLINEVLDRFKDWDTTKDEEGIRPGFNDDFDKKSSSCC